MKTKSKYTMIVEWSEEDGCYIGRCPELFFGGVHGNDAVKVAQELAEVIEEWQVSKREDDPPLPEPLAGKEFSGRFVLRVPPETHRLLSIRAMQEGRSLNAYCAGKLEEAASMKSNRTDGRGHWRSGAAAGMLPT